jgi:hypothetical protein
MGRTKVSYARGCAVDGLLRRPAELAEAEALARRADVSSVVLVVGLDGAMEGEGHDRASLGLPGSQVRKFPRF